MSYTIEDFKKDAARDMLEMLTPEERLELIGELPPEEIEAYLKKLKESRGES